jgi:5-phospho-D-xylono-1,4-lactonase
VIKVATSGERATEHERKVVEAAVIAHTETGATILTHAEQGTGALHQVQLFRDLGASLSNLVISHTDRKPDLVYHKEILSSAVMLEYDSAFRWPLNQTNPTLTLVLSMFTEVGEDQQTN